MSAVFFDPVYIDKFDFGGGVPYGEHKLFYIVVAVRLLAITNTVFHTFWVYMRRDNVCRVIRLLGVFLDRRVLILDNRGSDRGRCDQRGGNAHKQSHLYTQRGALADIPFVCFKDFDAVPFLSL